MALAGSLSYNAFTSSSSTITLENAKTVSLLDDGVSVVMRLNMDASAQPQVNTITIGTLPGANAYYRVAIDDYTTNPAQVFTVFLDTTASETPTTIAAKLAAMINAAVPSRPEVAATAATNTVLVTSLLPGTNGAFTATLSCLNAADNTAVSGSPITQTVANGTGTGRMRTVCQYDVVLTATDASSTTASSPRLVIDGIWYNGATPPVQQSVISPTNFTGPLSFDALRAVS